MTHLYNLYKYMYMVTYISKLIDSSHLDTQFSKKVPIKIFLVQY